MAAHTTMLVLAFSFSSGGDARAQPTTPLTTSNYGTIDVVDLPVLGAPRAVGLGGAYGSVGEGIAAAAWNPAAVATRARHETDWFEWEMTLGALFPSSSASSEFFGRTPGGVNTDSFKFFDVGFRFQFGPAAFGVLVRPRTFHIVDEATGLRESVTSQTVHTDLAWQFLHGDLVVGVGVRAVNFSVDQRMNKMAPLVNLLEISGANAEYGVTYRPHDRPFRVSSVVRMPIRAQRVVVGSSVDNTPFDPHSVTLPWELALSGTFGFGERPLSSLTPTTYRPRVRHRLERGTRERRAACEAQGMVLPTPPSPDAAHPPDANANPDTAPVEPVMPIGCDEFRPRPIGRAPLRPRYGFVTAELVIIGASRNAIGLDGYITQTRRTWGDHATVSPRIGVEGEPWRNRMKLRGGLYREPGRATYGSARAHFTSGFDFRLFDWDIFGILDEPMGFQVTGTGDFAPGYVSFGVGVGVWH